MTLDSDTHLTALHPILKVCEIPQGPQGPEGPEGPEDERHRDRPRVLNTYWSMFIKDERTAALSFL